MKKTIKLLLFVCLLAITLNSTSSLNCILKVQAATSKIDKSELSIYEGHTSTLKVTGASGSVTWSSNNNSVASVSTKGKVTAKKNGTAVITANTGGHKLQCRVTVLKVALNETVATLYVDAALILKVNDKKASVTWSSSNKFAASVDKRGIVVANNPGTATITAKISDTIAVSCIITVIHDPGIPTKLELVNVPSNMIAGEKQTISVSYFPSTSAGSEVYWEVGDEYGNAGSLSMRFNESTLTIEALCSGIACIRVVSFLDPSVYDEYYIEISNPTPDKSINTGIPDQTLPNTGHSTTPTNSPTKPIIKTLDGFKISQDSTITIYDSPIVRMTNEDFDYWDEMYYTLDGSTPTTSSSRCYLDTHIVLSDNCVLKMIGIASGSSSEVLTVNFKVRSNLFNWGTSEIDTSSCLYVMKNCPTEAATLLNAQEQALCSKAKSILASIITPGMSDYDKIKAIHDYICNNVTYAYDYVPNSEDAYGALINGTCVCGGYAEAYYLLVNMSDIYCMIIHGTALGIGHAWNLVYLDNEWYHVDCTWDDVNDTPYYKYFLIDDASMTQVHTWLKTSWVDQGITCSWPVCTSTKYLGDFVYSVKS